MKKLFFALMAVLAVTFAASCSKAAGELDDDPAKMTEQLKSELDKGDGNKFVEMISGVKDKAIGFVKDNPDKAKEYVQAAQKFLTDNADKVKEVIGKISDEGARTKAQGVIDGFANLDPAKLLP